MSLVSPVFLFNSLNTKRGGMTKATIHRANTLVSEYKETQFLTILFKRIIEVSFKIFIIPMNWMKE